MTEFEALVGLNLIPEIGSIRLNKLLKFFGSPQKILNVPRERLIAVSGIGEKAAYGISSLKEKCIFEEIEKAKKMGLRILTYKDHGYPGNLKNIPDFPIVIYLQGALEEKDALAFAIVGTRSPTFYGEENARFFSEQLAVNGFTIVSGMAKGIDTCAHKAALKAKGRTIAVIGSGLADIYPEENLGLSREIAENGAVISEFPVQTPPFKQNFPRRNRLISGLANAVLIIEAGLNSGALITADFALEQSREIYALPGKIDSYNSIGTNQLIKQGAKMVCCLEDILEDFNLPAVADTPAKSFLESLSCEEQALYNIITKQPVESDEIIHQTGWQFSKLANLILGLEMKKIIKKLPGGQLVRSDYGK